MGSSKVAPPVLSKNRLPSIKYMSTVYLYKKNTVDGLTVHQSQQNLGRPDNRRTRRRRLKIRSRDVDGWILKKLLAPPDNSEFICTARYLNRGTEHLYSWPIYFQPLTAFSFPLLVVYISYVLDPKCGFCATLRLRFSLSMTNTGCFSTETYPSVSWFWIPCR